MKKTTHVQVKVDTYTSDYKLLPGGLLYLGREMCRKDRDVQIDAYGPCWVYATAQTIEGIVSVRRRGTDFTMGGIVGIFLPPFSIVEWHMNPGRVCFDALYSCVNLPCDLPQGPVIFPLKSIELPKSTGEIFDILREQKDFLQIGREEIPSAVAFRTKKAIDDTYDKPVRIVDVARSLRYSPVVMSRAFKRCYGIPPVKYRNRLRVSDSIRLMLMNQHSIPRAAHGVGFEDLSQFNKQFRKETKAVPSQFRRS